MRILQRFQDYLSRQLSKTSKLDGRLLLLAILIVYFLPILIASFSPNYPELWNSLWIYPFVPKMLPPFADMRVVTSGAECIRLGYDVLVENPCDPWNRLMNYPRIWSTPASWGLDQSHTVVIGILCGLLFFIFTFVIIERLNYIEAVFYALILCSPSVMLAVERGNNDLIIFSLLALSLLIMASKRLILRFFSYVIILFATILKIYPIFALTSFLQEKRRNFTFIIIASLITFGVYVIPNFPSFKLVSQATPRSTKLSYGGKVIFDIIFKIPEKYFDVNLDSNMANYMDKVKLLIFILIISLVFVLAYLLVKRRETWYQNINTPGIYKKLDAFRIGASIYIGTFLIGNNWDYRLVFLLFTVPQILVWLKTPPRLTSISGLALMGIILTTWLSRYTVQVYLLDELINWLLFVFFTYTLILTLPKWLKSYLFFRPRDWGIRHQG